MLRPFLERISFVLENIFLVAHCEFLLSIHQVPVKTRLYFMSVFLWLAHLMDSLTLPNLSGYICAARHRR